jgi:hypothetical protein
MLATFFNSIIAKPNTYDDLECTQKNISQPSLHIYAYFIVIKVRKGKGEGEENMITSLLTPD